MATDDLDPTNRYEVLRRTRRKGVGNIFFIWDRQRQIYVDSSLVSSEMVDLADALNERDRKDCDYDNRS